MTIPEFHLRCIRCEEEAEARPDRYVCPRCGGNCEVVYPKARLARADMAVDGGIGRFAAVLPVDATSLPPVPIGPTPLYRRDDLAKRHGLARLEIKDDGRLPSCSFKDRASAVALARARDVQAREICTASTGNAAAAQACLGAAAGFPPFIFVPRKAPAGKIAQLVTFGAKIFLVDGNYDSACDLALAATERFGWYNRNTGFNPYTREGKKTVSYELLVQLEWQVPDWVVVPVGDGNIISGVWKGFREARELGLVDKTPRLLAAQSEKSNAITLAVQGDGVIRKVEATTVADSISVDLPRDGEAAVKAVRQSNGAAQSVSDEEILAAQKRLASSTGVFAEPAAACGYAALEKAAAAGVFGRDSHVLVLVTGNGLKDVGAITSRLPDLPVVPPDVRAVERALNFYR